MQYWGKELCDAISGHIVSGNCIKKMYRDSHHCKVPPLSMLLIFIRTFIYVTVLYLKYKDIFYHFSVDVDTLTAPAAIFWWILRWQIQVYCSENIMKGLKNTDNNFNFSHVWYICKIFVTQIRQDFLLRSTGRPSILA